MERSRAAHLGDMTSTSNQQIVEDFITALFTNGDLTDVGSSITTRRWLAPGIGPEGASGSRSHPPGLPDWRSDVQQMIAEGVLVVAFLISRAALMVINPGGAFRRPWHPSSLCNG